MRKERASPLCRVCRPPRPPRRTRALPPRTTTWRRATRPRLRPAPTARRLSPRTTAPTPLRPPARTTAPLRPPPRAPIPPLAPAPATRVTSPSLPASRPWLSSVSANRQRLPPCRTPRTRRISPPALPVSTNSSRPNPSSSRWPRASPTTTASPRLSSDFSPRLRPLKRAWQRASLTHRPLRANSLSFSRASRLALATPRTVLGRRLLTASSPSPRSPVEGHFVVYRTFVDTRKEIPFILAALGRVK
ncbi:hypothetical protein FB45DRAFT_1050769, partial [Roridomyces roridus]